MAPRRTVLLVDPDPATVDVLAPALRRRGHHLHAVQDGSRALQHAIARSPDLILLDEATPLIDARTLLRILRSNPRTGHIPVLVAGSGAEPLDGVAGPVLRKPLDADDVVARVEHAFRRLDLARASAGNARLEGSLAQLSIPDLLQVLASNRRAGTVTIEHDGVRGTIAIGEGRIAAVEAGAVSGEKALFRLLSVQTGRFVFAPGPPRGAGPVIDRRLDDLLLDGIRRSDELAAVAASLPPMEDLLIAATPPRASDRDALATGLLDRLATPRSLRDLLDGVDAGDVEIARAVAALLESGAIRRAGAREGGEPGTDALLATPELHALRARLLRGRASSAATGKLLLVGGGRSAHRNALARLATLRGFATARDETVVFGTIGRLTLDDGIAIDVVALPARAELHPLWEPLGANALAAMVLVPAVDVADRLAALARGSRLVVGVCAPSRDAFDPEPLRDLAGGCPWLGNDAAEAARILLSRAAGA